MNFNPINFSLQSPYTNNDAQGFVALAHEILSHVDESGNKYYC